MTVRWHLTSRQNLIANLSLDQLYTFQVVVRTGSFSGAAAELALTQAAVSQRIRRLEELLGCSLFERRRGTRGSLSLAGQDLLAFADEILSRTDRFHQRLEQMKSRSEHATLTIASGSDHIKHLLVEAVVAFKRKEPSISVIIHHEPSNDRIVEELSSGRADLGICRSPTPKGMKTLGMIHEELYLYARPDHRLKSTPQEKRLDMLNHTNFASFAAGMRSRELVDRWVDKLGVAPRVVVESRNVEAMRAYAVRGLAVAVLPRFSVVDDVRANQLADVSMPGLPLTRSAAILAQPERAASYEIRMFLSALPVPVSDGPWEDLSS